jgi:hypothetical protein
MSRLVPHLSQQEKWTADLNTNKAVIAGLWTAANGGDSYVSFSWCRWLSSADGQKAVLARSLYPIDTQAQRNRIMQIYDDTKDKQLELEIHLGLKRPGYGLQECGSMPDNKALGEKKLREAWREDLRETVYRQTHNSARAKRMAELKSDRRQARALINRYPDDPSVNTTSRLGTAAEGRANSQRASEFISSSRSSVDPLTSALSQSAHVTSPPRREGARSRPIKDIHANQDELKSLMDGVWTAARKLKNIVSRSRLM